MPSISLARSALKRVSATTTYATTSSSRHSMSTMHSDDPDTPEIEKKHSSSKKQHTAPSLLPEAPGWNESLASASEAFVKADRATPTSTNDLQAQTVEYVTKQYSPDDRMSSTTAVYSRDEVAGPLGSAPGREGNQEAYSTVKRVNQKVNQKKVGEPSR